MLIHDFAPNGAFREALSGILDVVTEYWQLITSMGVLGFALAVAAFIKSRSYLVLSVGVVGLLVSGFFYSLINGLSRSGI